ncbi:MAG TPA: hypothetical protein VF188_04165 [Longimicrobiales bacterium]
MEPDRFAAAAAWPARRRRRYTVALPVLGIPVRFRTESAALLAAVEAAYGGWRGLFGCPESDVRATTSSRVTVLLDEDEHLRATRRTRFETRIEHGRLLLVAGDAAGCADPGRGAAAVRLAPDTVATPGRFREVVDTFVLFLLTRRDRAPVHAAGVARDGAGLVLAGESGAGKSTLAYAAFRAGLRVLGEDAVYVQLEPRFRVWGMGRAVHLTPEAAALFPELAGRAVVLRGNGKRKVAVDIAPPAPPPPPVERAGLCLVDRGAGPVRVEPIEPADAVARLTSRLDPGFDHFRGTIAARLHAIVAGGAWMLHLSADPGAALPCLLDLLDRVGGGR